MGRKLIDLTGQRFEKLVALEYRGKSKWLCRCDCGTEKEILGHDLRSGHTCSCGCMRGAKARHGMTGTSEYNTWRDMRHRCENGSHPRFNNYGGRGITVCERWQEFEAFYEDMGPRPSPGHSLDRIDNDGPYSPENCRWATWSQQNSNRRPFQNSNNQMLTYGGKTQSVTDWAEEIGLSYPGLLYRLQTYGDVKRALTKEPQRRRSR